MSKPEDFKKGVTVHAHGLKNAARLNCQYGNVVGPQENGRVGVKMLNEAEGEKSLLPKNLKICKDRFEVKVGSVVKIAYKRSTETDDASDLCGYFGTVNDKLGPKDFMVKVKVGAQMGCTALDSVETEVHLNDLELLSKTYASHPGEPLIKGDQNGMLELIRTTELGDTHLCHETGDKCYEVSYQNAPINFAARIFRNDLNGPPGAAPMDANSPQVQMIKSMGPQMGLAATLPLDAMTKKWQIEQLSHAKRHILHVSMDGIG